MGQLKIFENEEFGQIRTVMRDGEVWFVGKDVANGLGYSNARKALGDHVDKEDKGVTKRDTLGGVQELTIVNESAFTVWSYPASFRQSSVSNAGLHQKCCRRSERLAAMTWTSIHQR